MIRADLSLEAMGTQATPLREHPKGVGLIQQSAEPT